MLSGRNRSIRGGMRIVDKREGEVWLPVPSHPALEASNLGRIRRITLMPPITGNQGYEMVEVLSNEPKKRTRVTTHQLIAEAFLGLRPAGLVINHKDGDRLNNLPENLEYVTHQENIQHAAKLGRMARFDKMSWKAKLDAEQVRSIREELALGTRQIDIARKYGLHRHTIQLIRKNLTWRPDQVPKAVARG